MSNLRLEKYLYEHEHRKDTNPEKNGKNKKRKYEEDFEKHFRDSHDMNDEISHEDFRGK